MIINLFDGILTPVQERIPLSESPREIIESPRVHLILAEQRDVILAHVDHVDFIHRHFVLLSR